VAPEGYNGWMTDPHLEDHAFGVELQLNELVEEQARARVQDLPERVASLQAEIETLQDDLATTSDQIAEPGHEESEVVDERSILDP